MVPKVWATLCESTTSPAPETRRQVAPGRGVPHDQWRTALSLAGRGSGRPRPGYLGAASAQQEGSQEVLSQVAQGLNLCATGAHHGSVEERRGGQAGDAPRRGTSPESRSQYP